MRAILTTLLLFASLVVPSAAAVAPSCASVTTSTSTPTGVYAVPLSGATGYDLWAETNLVDGLQKVACTDAEGNAVAADQHVAPVGIAHGGQPVCIVRVGCIWI